MSDHQSSDPKVYREVCDACCGDGFEEGMAWAGESCSECNGSGFILVDEGDDDQL